MWVKPTGYNDPNSGWSDEAKAYDDNLFTYALNAGDDTGKYLELTHSAISCDKVRIYTCWIDGEDEAGADETYIDVYYGGSWHNIWHDDIEANTWTEAPIGSTQTVTVARVKSGHPLAVNFVVKEFEFNSVISAAARGKVGGSLAAGRKGLI